MIEAFFTIAATNYLAQVKTLFSSLQKVHPESKRYLILVGDAPDSIDATLFDIINATSIDIDNFADMATRYSVMECSTAIKPSAFLYFFDRLHYNNIIYLDPDIFVYTRLELIATLFETNYDIILTPHITSYIDDIYIPNELSFSQSGQYNLGFLAAKATGEVKGYLAWWARRLATQAGSNPKLGTFTDQKWCDSIPSFLTNYFILKHSGYNVAYWNMYQKSISRVNGVWYIGSDLLVFFHFSGISISDEHLISKHQNRLEWSSIGLYQTLFSEYRRLLVLHGWHSYHLTSYTYDYFDDMSCKISPIIRSLYHYLHPSVTPISFASQRLFITNMCHAIPLSQRGKEFPLNYIQYFIYISTTDLLMQFNINDLKGRLQFHSWFKQAGATAFELSDEFLPKNHSVQRPALGNSIIRLRYTVVRNTFLLTRRIYTWLPPTYKRLLYHHFKGLITVIKQYSQ